MYIEANIRMCPKCGKPHFSVDSITGAMPNKCEFCGTQLVEIPVLLQDFRSPQYYKEELKIMEAPEFSPLAHQKYKEWRDAKYNQIMSKAKPQPQKPKCPYCNSTRLEKISSFKKAGKIGLFGIFGAGDIGKTYKCRNCGCKF